MNPYLRAAYSRAGGGFQPPAGAYFGAAQGSGQFAPAPASYFGAAAAPGAQQHCCCPAPAGAPTPYPYADQAIDPSRAAQLTAMLRHPLGQWPNMPPLAPPAVQDAAACTVCHAQTHADDLVIVYGVDSGVTLIPAGATATVTVTPQKRHIPERLVMSAAMAGNFLVTGIFAGVEPVLATTGPISAAIFVQDSTAQNFKSVIMDVGMDFSVGVTNISGADARFTATVVGKPVPPGL